jgi:NADPH:quinone reductase-like Zn-dependent oxidoreductase
VRAAVLTALGEPQFGEFNEPEPGAGRTVVEVLAAGLNPVDILLAAGVIPMPGAPMPRVVGTEGVGTLDGRRVYFGAPSAPLGSWAARTLVDPAETFPVPDEVSDSMAVALGIPGLTAWLSLSWRARLERGENVLVLGASGAVGTLAVQAAALLGAGRVIGAARSATALAALPSLGADAVVSLEQAPDALAQAFSEAADGRIDVIVDTLWGPAAVGALMAASPGARLVQLGGSAARDVSFDPAMMRYKQTAILGMSVATTPRAVRAEAYAELTRLAADDQIRSSVTVLPLEDVSQAWRQQQMGSAGQKLVLAP